jgi:hypothetical protein
MSKIVVVIGSMAWAMLLTLASGTAWAAIECTAASACRGTDGPNTMYGSRSEDQIYGKGGSDVIDATGGVDEVYGGDGPDAGLYGGNGRDLVRGGAGQDKAIGGSGADTMRGAKGRDELWGMEPPTRSTAVPTMTYCTAPETVRRPTRCAVEAGSTSATSISTTG